MRSMIDRRRALIGLPTLAAGIAAASGLAHAQQQSGAPSSEFETPSAEFVYEAIVTLGPGENPGAGPLGGRVRIPITGGTFSGPAIKGVVLPSGEDWQLIRPDGFVQIEANYWMRCDDGTLIHVINKGVVGKGYGRTTPWFEVAKGPHEWLNQAVFVGTLGPVPESEVPAVRIRVFKLV